MIGPNWLLRLLGVVALTALLAFTVTCGDDGDDDDGEPTSTPTEEATATEDATATKEPEEEDEGDAGDGGLGVSSTEFEDGDAIPVEFTCDGDDVAPPISWTGIPEGTQSLALVMDDPDANNFVHWVVYDIDPKVTGFGVTPVEPELPSGAKQAINDLGEAGYKGPCPPEGEEHTYSFRVYALDRKLEQEGGAPAADVIAAIDESGQLGEGELTGTYERE